MKRFLSLKPIQFLASIKFAIPVLFAFAACQIAGTILESRYGAAYAGRRIYFTWWFFAVLGAIVVSVTLSMLARLPFKRRLLGFYTVHVSIVIIIIGAVVTRWTGLDGTITLAPGQSNNAILHGDDHIYVYKGMTELRFKLPTTVDETELSSEIGKLGAHTVRALQYLPYAQEQIVWRKGGNAWTSRWLVKNAQFAEQLNLADQPLLEMGPRAEMGPLTLKVVSPAVLARFAEASKVQGQKPLVLADRVSQTAVLVRTFPSRFQLARGRTVEVGRRSMHSGNLTFYSVETSLGSYRFFPRFSTFPVQKDLTEQLDSPFELFDLSLFGEKPTVLIARTPEGQVRLAYGKSGDWKVADLKSGAQALPWMGITLSLLNERIGETPVMEYSPAVPDKDDAKNTRAALIEIQGPSSTERAWVSNRREFHYTDGDVELRSWINPQALQLPWRLTLEEFKMDKVPGTEEAASYESVVKVGSDPENVRIYMNNPLKKDGYTLYQSSYFQDDQGRTNTVLSVNRDPGRPIKYAGSLLLVFGMILHFSIIHGVVRLDAKSRRENMSSKSGVRKGVSEAIGLSVLFALVFIFSAPPAVAASEFQGMSACQDATLERTALLAEGRAVPLAVHARRIRKGLLSDTCKSLSDTALYCLLAHGERARLSESLGCKVELKVEHAKLKSLVGMESEAMSAPVAQVEGRRFQLEGDYRGLEANQQLQTGYGVALTRLLNNLKQLSMIESGEDWRVRVSADEWKPKSKFASTAEFFDAVSASERFLSSNEKKAMSHEELYERLHLFPLSALVCIVAFAASIAGGRSPRARQWAMGLAVGLLALEAFTMYLRVVISGRAPVTNMFETVMWTSFGVLTLSVLMSLFNREKAILTLGLAVNMIGLFMLNFATTMLDSSIRPLVPVLRDNFWLSTHVTTVTLAYASFAMSWISANFVLGAFLVGQARGEFIERWNHISRVAMQVGAVLLSAGVILGGVWADYSWGRFWGWDPKETWSLIALMIYIAVLHGKYVGWFKGLRFAMVGAGAFLFVLMAWFGVNYILAAGLHSYGFSNGGAAFLATTFAGQAVILVATYLREIGLRSRGLARASLTSERA